MHLTSKLHPAHYRAKFHACDRDIFWFSLDVLRQIFAAAKTAPKLGSSGAVGLRARWCGLPFLVLQTTLISTKMLRELSSYISLQFCYIILFLFADSATRTERHEKVLRLWYDMGCAFEYNHSAPRPLKCAFWLGAERTEGTTAFLLFEILKCKSKNSFSS